MAKATHYNVVIIGTGFGGTMTGLSLAREFVKRQKNESILMLERGTWWTTPVGTVQDQEVKTYQFIQQNGHPVQFWASQNTFRGFIDLFTRCTRRKCNEDGLYDISRLGKRPILGLFGGNSDGVTIIRASGVGGGSLVYSNITIRPPDFVLDDPRWPIKWNGQRDFYYDLARDAIGHGVLWALDQRPQTRITPPAVTVAAKGVNTGLSNIVTRSANLHPHWTIKPLPGNSRGLKQITDPTQPPPAQPPQDQENHLWIDRARLFQTAMSKLTSEFGAVDLAINDFDPSKNLDDSNNRSNQFDPQTGAAKNYCERQGRCNVGCLPGARHTLNKQLMVAAVGNPLPKPAPQLFNNLEIEPLAEVQYIRALPGGRYEIPYWKRNAEKPSQKTNTSITADVVIVAAGCLGSSEIMLRSKAHADGLPNLSDRVGYGFSTNGDYIAFLEPTKERMRLTRGPVTTSFGHVHTGDPKTAPPGEISNPEIFHTIEDQGIPPALASVVGEGVPLIRRLASTHKNILFVIIAVLRWLRRRAWHFVCAFFKNFARRQDIFKSDDEILAQTLCVVAQGREASTGQFRLGTGWRDTPLRVSRKDANGNPEPFHKDPIYVEIRKSLTSLAQQINDQGRDFINPFLNPLTHELEADSIALSHPLGGCRMGSDATQGVVDEFGRVFDASGANGGFYPGLYIADGSIIPTALGLNPSLTISAVCMRIALTIIANLPQNAPISAGSLATLTAAQQKSGV
jgi:choline dehydrogenase-like flavoprotein